MMPSDLPEFPENEGKTDRVLRGMPVSDRRAPRAVKNIWFLTAFFAAGNARRSAFLRYAEKAFPHRIRVGAGNEGAVSPNDRDGRCSVGCSFPILRQLLRVQTKFSCLHDRAEQDDNNRKDE